MCVDIRETDGAMTEQVLTTRSIYRPIRSNTPSHAPRGMLTKVRTFVHEKFRCSVRTLSSIPGGASIDLSFLILLQLLRVVCSQRYVRSYMRSSDAAYVHYRTSQAEHL